MSLTLLKLTQDLLSEMESDEVNSISGTVESLQVATIIQNIFEDIVIEYDIPSHYEFVNLTASGDNTKPTLMTIPEGVEAISWLKYDKQETADSYPNYEELTYLDLPEFLRQINGYRTETSNVGSFTHTGDSGTVTFMFKSNEMPSRYTSFDDETLIFDSYDIDEDTTLQSSKTQCYALVTPSLTLDDASVVDLPRKLIGVLRNEARARCFGSLKQMTNVNAERHERRLRIRSQQRKQKSPYDEPAELHRVPNYGRK